MVVIIVVVELGVARVAVSAVLAQRLWPKLA